MIQACSHLSRLTQQTGSARTPVSVGIVGQTGSTSSPVGRMCVMDGWTGADASWGENEERGGRKKCNRGGPDRKVQMYYSVWLQLQLDVTEFTKEEGETTAVM